MLDKFVRASMSVMDLLARSGKKHPGDYCDLETVDAPTVLVSHKGSLVSLVEITGIKRLISNHNYYHIVLSQLTTSLSPMFSTKAHALQVVFEVDPDRTEEELRGIQSKSLETARKLNMDLDDLFDERVKTLKDWTNSEKCYIALWTNPEALSKTEQKHEKKMSSDRLSGKITSIEGQNPLAATAMIRNKHLSFVDTFISELESSDIMTRLYKARDALRIIRESIDPSFTDVEWQASLPGDKIYPSQRRDSLGMENWDIIWPTLGSQLAPRDAKIIDNNVVEMGDRIYAPIYVDLFPKKPTFFADLFGRCLERHMPWRISFLMEGDGLGGFGFKAMVASLLSFASSGNKMIDRAYKELKAFQDQQGETMVTARISLCTWAKKGEDDLLQKRLSDLATCVQGWGDTHVSEVTGNPLAGLSSTVVGFSQGSIGTKTAAPMIEFLGMMPWARPASPWKYGAVTFRTPEGKIMPYQPYSSEQVSWISLIFARPGSGKSVLMNLCNLALAVAPGHTRLPRIAIIDIGPSSSGLIYLLKEALPPAQKHLVTHRRLKMVERDSINPFDTQLGCRFPVPSELAFLRNLVTLLVTDYSVDHPDKGMPNLVTAVIDEMYKMRADKGNSPQKYSSGLNNEVDSAIKKYNIATDGFTTWWEVVDELFKANETRAAAIAQRYAVPLLSDAVGVAQSERIKSTFGALMATTGENLIDSFCRMIGDALAMYPIMARPTAFDVGESRIVSLDLDEVAKAGGVVADRQTAVMYMLARQALAKDFYLNKDIIGDMPAPANIELRDTVPAQEYRDYHKERIENLLEDPKRICYDEFHRTSKASMVREQVLLDMREGRKWKVDIMLSSQDLKDFDETMIKMASGVFVMDGGNASTIDEISQTFGFSDPAERHALERRVKPPKKGGGVFMAKFATKAGWYTMLLSATLGAMELWAFSTTAEDVSIRNRLYERIGHKRALKVLSYVYPHGSAQIDVEDRKAKMRDAGKEVMEGEALSVIETIVNDLLDQERRLT